MRYAIWGLVAVLAVAGLVLSSAIAEETKPAAKASETKAAEVKATETKAADTKATETKATAAEPAKDSAGTIEVKLGQKIERTIDQIKADNFAYGPKQDFDDKTGETHIYLPYGNNAKLYADVAGVLTDPKAGSLAKFGSQDGSTDAHLTYKLHFDKPIGAIRFETSLAEVDLRPDTSAGADYSVDGKEWKSLYELKGDDKGVKTIESFIKNAKADGLNTQTLYIRIFIGDPKNPGASGAGRWIQMWLSGDPSWGDAATTFVARQPQLWVTAAKDASAKEPAAKAADTKATETKAPAAKATETK